MGEKVKGRVVKDTKRAEQNRIAQKIFRDRQSSQNQDMKAKLISLEGAADLVRSLELQVLELKRQSHESEAERNQAIQERDKMIHTVDRLRADNSTLKEVKRKVRTTSARGNFGLPTPPAKEQLPKWTSNINTFLSLSTSVQGEEHESKAVWSNNNNYPGYPSWTPPSFERVPLAQPPYHLALSYVEKKVSPRKGGKTFPNAFQNAFHPDASQYTLHSSPAYNAFDHITLPVLAEDQTFFMPFLPSTNAMIGLYHHMPFESLGSSSFESPLQTSEMSFEPLEDAFGRLKDVFIP